MSLGCELYTAIIIFGKALTRFGIEIERCDYIIQQDSMRRVLDILLNINSHPETH